jgi:aspartate/methionine/tyrosine aminotransferase
MWEEEGVKVMPGSFMSRDNVGSGFVRIALVYDEESTKEALLRIKNSFKTSN